MFIIFYMYQNTFHFGIYAQNMSRTQTVKGFLVQEIKKKFLV